MKSRRVAVAHPGMGKGGSELPVMFALEALVASGHRVSLITGRRPDFDALNAWCGTRLAARDVEVLETPAPPVPSRLGNAAALRGAWFQRRCRALASRFDVLMSGYNPLDFGVPALHLIADFSWHEALRLALDPLSSRTGSKVHRPGAVRDLYLAVTGCFAAPSGRDVFAGQDLLLANSAWTAGLLRREFPKARVEVEYPPVPFVATPLPFADRLAEFVCLGRISYEKRVEDAIEVLRRTRELGHDVRLRILGNLDEETPYGLEIARLARENAAWVTVEAGVFGAAKEAALVRRRFAIHARRDTFGIAVAEEVKAGCITFVRDDSGATEIVDDPRLAWATVEEGVARVDAVLKDAGLQQRLSAAMIERGRRFDVEAYRRGIVRAVEGFDP